MKTLNLRWNARKTVMALALAGAMGGVAAGPALADEGNWHRGDQQRYEHQDRREQVRDHDWRVQAWHRQEWREPVYREHRAYAYAAPSYRYAAPGYAYAPRPGVNFVIPFDIR